MYYSRSIFAITNISPDVKKLTQIHFVWILNLSEVRNHINVDTQIAAYCVIFSSSENRMSLEDCVTL